MKGPSGEQITGWEGDLDTPEGVPWWTINPALPTDAPSGTYTYAFSVTYNGKTSSKSTTFSVRDPDDNRRIKFGQTLTGTINPANDRDRYRFFNGVAGQVVSIQMNWVGGDLDPYLQLRAPSGRLVAWDNDSGGNRNALINRVVLQETGRYNIIASSYKSRTTGSYTIRLTRSR